MPRREAPSHHSNIRLRVLATIGAIVMSFLLLTLPWFLNGSAESPEMALSQPSTSATSSQTPPVTTPSAPTSPTAVAAPSETASVGTKETGQSTATAGRTGGIAGLAVIHRLLPPESSQAVEEAIIRAGDTVRAESDTRVELRLVDGSVIELDPNSTLRVVDLSIDEGYGKLYHSTGTMKLAVRSPLLWWQLDTQTLAMSPRLEHTEFTIEVTGEGTRLAVTSGVVFARRGDEAVVVRAGEGLEAGSHNTLHLDRLRRFRLHPPQ